MTSLRFQNDPLLQIAGDRFILSCKYGCHGEGHSPCFPALIHQSVQWDSPILPIEPTRMRGGWKSAGRPPPGRGLYTMGEDLRKAGGRKENSSMVHMKTLRLREVERLARGLTAVSGRAETGTHPCLLTANILCTPLLLTSRICDWFENSFSSKTHTRDSE